MPKDSLHYQQPLYIGLLIAIVVLFLLIGGLYAALTPPWQAPDEPAHYNYIAQVAGHGCCPVITPSDWNAAQLEALKAAQFPDNASVAGVTYEDHQPPLYYLIAAPVFNLTHGSLFAMRLVSLILGAGVIAASYYATARLFPQKPVIALGAALLVGFIPQHVAILASVNNDSLAELLIGMLLVIALGYLGNPVVPDYEGKPMAFEESRRPHAATLGGFLGLIFLTKLTVYGPAILVVLLAIAWRWRIEGRSAGWLIHQLFWVGVLALPLGALWWVRNSLIYGFPDIMAQAAHNAAVVGQPRTAEVIARLGTVEYLREALTITYHSFWGQFGWMGVPMQPRVYQVLGLFLMWAITGTLILFFRYRRELGTIPGLGILVQQRAAMWVLIWAGIATAAEVVYYNFSFEQFQGRYFYPALIPLALLVVLGACGWAFLLKERLAVEERRGPLAGIWERALVWFPALAVFWMPFFALYALFRYVIPYLG